MHKSLIVASLVLFPATAFAQDATAPTPPAVVIEKPSLSDAVPTPRETSEADGYRVAAISAGAVAGVVVANVLTGGLITPVLLAGSGGAVMSHGLGWMAVSTGTTAVGAVAGGYAGDWLYEQ
jgi:uncharacterized protein YcfJ